MSDLIVQHRLLGRQLRIRLPWCADSRVAFASRMRSLLMSHCACMRTPGLRAGRALIPHPPPLRRVRYSTNCDLKVWSQVEKSFCNFLFPICAEQLSRAIQDMAASSAAGSGSSPCPCSTPVQIYGGRAQPPEARARAHHPGAGLHMRACETIRCAGASCHEAQRRHAAKKVEPHRRRRHV